MMAMTMPPLPQRRCPRSCPPPPVTAGANKRARVRTVPAPHWQALSQSLVADAIDFIDGFPVLTGTFGYTRGPSNDASKSVLEPFMDNRGDYVVYGEVCERTAKALAELERAARAALQLVLQHAGLKQPPKRTEPPKPKAAAPKTISEADVKLPGLKLRSSTKIKPNWSTTSNSPKPAATPDWA